MNTLRQAAQKAVQVMDDHMMRADTDEFYEAKEALRQALAQEVTTQVTTEVTGDVAAVNMSQERVDEKAKRGHEWVGLTDEEIQDLSYLSQKIDASNSEWFDRWGFARAVEQALKEKNT